jgi:hypothetical protein
VVIVSVSRLSRIVAATTIFFVGYCPVADGGVT